MTWCTYHRVTVRKLNVTDRQTDGAIAISPVPGPTMPAGDNKGSNISVTMMTNT